MFKYLAFRMFKSSFCSARNAHNGFLLRSDRTQLVGTVGSEILDNIFAILWSFFWVPGFLFCFVIVVNSQQTAEQMFFYSTEQSYASMGKHMEGWLITTGYIWFNSVVRRRWSYILYFCYLVWHNWQEEEDEKQKQK